MTITELHALADWHAARAERETDIAEAAIEGPLSLRDYSIAEGFARQHRTAAAFHHNAANKLRALAAAFQELCSGQPIDLKQTICRQP